ncbi:MAG: diguanylate cyclase [Acidobacteria bacterium]|nr:diguanylate cyclase [Acidobacteriota bacterium]
MKQELEYSNTLMRTQQECALDGILVVSEKGKIVSYNQKYVDIWKLPEEILASRSNERALEYASGLVLNCDAANAVVRDLYENRRSRSHDEILLRDGRVLERYSAPLEADDGRYYGRVWYFRDITPHKKAEDRIRQANERLRGTISQLKEQKKQSGILSEMREILQACDSTSEVGSIVRRSMLKLFPHASGALYMMGGSGRELEAVAAWGPGSDAASPGSFPTDHCWALRRGRLHLVDEPGAGPVCAHLRKGSRTPSACVPLAAKGEVLGILHLRVEEGVPQEIQARTTGQIGRLATTIGEYLSLSIANLRLRERLAEQSIRDPLTGLYNRRYMEEALGREISRAERNHTPVAVVMLDIDHFKPFNDRYGHPAGDALLESLGAFLKTNLRGGDAACRYGGEEFILFLPDTSLEGACRNMERIREGIGSLRISHLGRRLPPVMVSIGISAYPDHGKDMHTLIHAADRALYRAKDEGRNRILAAAG